tara:strand:+ start:11991 stop:12392 length:402 start_codon:yes stop_codon:yes gene_type:complete
MRTQLLCTFTQKPHLTDTVDIIIQTYTVLYNKIFILREAGSANDLMCTYNIDASGDFTIMDNTISLHRKKNTNTLYTINALNNLIKLLNNGMLDTSYQVDWNNYKNTMLVTNDEGLRRINTEIEEVIYIKKNN